MTTIPFVYYSIGGLVSILALISLFYLIRYCNCTKGDFKT
jgi:hypothetical protein